MPQDEAQINWPPPYKLIKHRRARHVKMRPSAQYGLEITVPYRFNLNELSAILDSHKEWIIKHLQLIQYQPITALPTHIALGCCQQNWKIIYVEMNSRLQLMERPDNEMVLLGNVKDKAKCQAILIRKLKQHASTCLIPILNQVSQMIHLPYQTVTVRDHKSRWGSCSSKKELQLSYKLIFLPHQLIEHVMIHELCHTKHMNHSPLFWALVASFDAAYSENKKALRNANQYVPQWINSI